jgi:hypothetical protein
MGLVAVALEISSVLASDGWSHRRGQWGRAVAGVALTTSGLIVLGALSYGLAAEGWRLANVARSAAADLLPGG